MSTFHIHVDAAEIEPQFEKYLAQAGFVRTDFAGHPEGVEGFEAPNHLTLKLDDAAEFRRRFDEAVSTARKIAGVRGYIEGEFIPIDRDLPDKPHRKDVDIPFRVTSGPVPQGSFRETEIHITLDRDRSDPGLLASLTEMGFFSAYMRKSYGLAQIFTVQGTRKEIDRLLPELLAYLDARGGTSNCSVKEERVARYWLSAPDAALPPIIEQIDWASERA